MSESTTVTWLSDGIGQAVRSAKFCVSGSLPILDPGLEVEGLGAVPVPLKRGTVKQLVAACRVAPYGKGTRTLVDKKVRNTFELDPKRFNLSEEWDRAIAEVTQQAAGQLGLPTDQLEARLYKLLVYQRGGFFLPHRDSEKQNRMVASLIVVLPNPFDGGGLVVRHGAAEQKLTFEEAAAGRAPCYAAFYADCEHEVRSVERGVRMALAYNLVLKPRRGKRSAAPRASAPAEVLAGSIRSWVETQPAEPLVFALEHHYTQRGLSLDLLKGADRELAGLVPAAAEEAGCHVHLAQVTRHLLQFADDGSFGRGYRYRFERPARRSLEIGEIYEDELHGAGWTDLRGKKQPWGEIRFDISAIVSQVPIDDWKPSFEEFEGYTGNAGNTLDRWYHRSAIVVWRREDHYDVIARSGAVACIPWFSTMASKLAKAPKKRLEQAREECIRFARAIISRWPRQFRGYRSYGAAEKSPLEEFPDHLLKLEDRETVAMFLSKLAEQDQMRSLKTFVPAACRQFGWGAFASELKQLLSSQSGVRGRDDIPIRDVEWLSAYCCSKAKDADKTALAQELCALAVERFCQPQPQQPSYGYRQRSSREPSVAETSLTPLIKALLAAGCEPELERLIRFVQESPEELRLDEGQVPALKALVPWSSKRLGQVPGPLASWLKNVREHLESVTAAPPQPPADWTRPAKVDCTCRFCDQLNAFLADPAKETERIPAREDRRLHLIDMFNRYQCDVKHALLRQGTPYSLVLTKTAGAYERAVKRFERGRQLLAALPPAD